MAVEYEFPTIHHLDDVLPYIDEDCFGVKSKDGCGLTYINYLKMGDQSFPPFNCPPDRSEVDAWNLRAAIRRECRGIAFDTLTGLIVSRPFHKFFNVGEREDMDINTLPWNKAHLVQDKVDGSMIRPLYVRGEVLWGTKMGPHTDVGVAATKFANARPQYIELWRHAHEQNYTPLFEYVGPHNRVVVEYEEDMILLACRGTVDGNYVDRDTLLRLGERFGVPVVKAYDPVEGDPTAYIDAVRESDDLDEGVVIWWPNGAAKCKTDTYSALHHVKEAARTERTLVKAIFAGKVDDLLPLLPDEDRQEVLNYVERFWACVHMLEDNIGDLYGNARAAYETKKDFAIGEFGAKALTGMETRAVFGLWDGKIKSAMDAAMQIVNMGLTSETKWAEMKEQIAKAPSLRKFDAGWKEVHDVE